MTVNSTAPNGRVMGHVKVGTYKGQVEVLMYCHWRGDYNTASGYLSFTDEQIDQLIQELEDAKQKRAE